MRCCRKRTKDYTVPYIIESDKCLTAYRKGRVTLIQKIYEFDPLTCLKCRRIIRIISFIGDQEVIRTIRMRQP
ncbi:MAG: hypothetical protein C0390_10670 [Syntrophus sp. (in: bacteria)]|nr:hypothetical protein [Syntrophus sp. (in: bacteria)]